MPSLVTTTALSCKLYPHLSGTRANASRCPVMTSALRKKPKKPYPSFPLTAHPNGQWCKKIRGKVHFFGVWADPDAALERYHAQALDLHAGRQPHPSSVSANGLTVKDVCNAFLAWQQGKLDAGEIGYRWFEDCRSILRRFARAVGQSRLVDDLSQALLRRPGAGRQTRCAHRRCPPARQVHGHHQGRAQLPARRNPKRHHQGPAQLLERPEAVHMHSS